jgi:ribosome-associated protein
MSGPGDGGVPEVAIRDASIRLGQFLKLADLVDTGADVKPLLADGDVQVNGEVETRRGRQLVPGDVVRVDAPAGVRTVRVANG